MYNKIIVKKKFYFCIFCFFNKIKKDSLLCQGSIFKKIIVYYNKEKVFYLYNFLYIFMSKFITFSKKELKELKEFLKNNKTPNFNTPMELASFKRTAKKFCLKEDKVYYKGSKNDLLVFAVDDMNEKANFLSEIHNNGYRGRDTLRYLLKQSTYGINDADIMGTLKRCVPCQAKKNIITKKEIKPICERWPRDRYIADIIFLGQKEYIIHNLNYSYLLTVVDSFSKYAYCSPIIQKSAKTLCFEFEKMFSIIGEPVCLHTDNGKEFINEEVKKLLEKYNVRHVKGRPACPWIQGQVERFNKSIKNMLSASAFTNTISTVGWLNELYSCVYKYNTVPHETTKKIPFQLFMGARTTLEKGRDHIEALYLYNDVLLQEVENARKNTDKAIDKMIKQRRWANDADNFNIGNTVLFNVDVDNNIKKRKRPLNDHLDHTIYTIMEIDHGKQLTTLRNVIAV